jgi:hypothetical protein
MQQYWEFYVGLAVQTLLFLAGGYAMVLRSDWSTQNLKEQIVGMQAELRKLAEVVIQQAIQSTRLDHLDEHIAQIDRRVEDLRRGRGRVIEDEQ